MPPTMGDQLLLFDIDEPNPAIVAVRATAIYDAARRAEVREDTGATGADLTVIIADIDAIDPTVRKEAIAAITAAIVKTHQRPLSDQPR